MLINALIDWCIKNRPIVIIFAALLAFLGIWAVKTTPIDAIPDLTDVQVIISTTWMGRDPQIIEDQITYPIMTEMLKVPGARDVRGYSFFGFSFVYVIFEDGTDLYWARSRVLEYLSGLSGKLPTGVSPSIGPDATGLGWVYMYTVEAGYYCEREECDFVSDKPGTCPHHKTNLEKANYDLGDLRALQDWFVRYQLTAVPGVSEVATVGGVVRQFQITVDPRKLLLYNIPLPKIIQAIRQSNNDVGGRVIELTETEYFVVGRGYIRALKDIENIVIGASADGTPVKLIDVADVALGPDIKRGIAEKDGKGEVVAGIVVMRYGENAYAVIKRVKEKIKEIQKALPKGVFINTSYDRSALIERTIDTLTHQLGEEMVIVAIVCILFLLHIPSTLVAWIVLPLGVLGAFIIMKWIGVTSNIMSLGGIAISIGVMVDASCVFVENLHKHKERREGINIWQLVLDSSKEVGPGIFISLLIVTVSFLPVFALEEQEGRLFKPLAYTKTLSMLSASILSITLIPILMGFFVRGKSPSELANPINRFFIAVYIPVMKWVLSHKLTSILIAVGILAVTYYPLTKIESEFMPPIEEGDILYMPTTLPGISSTEARRTLQIQDRLIKQFPEVISVLGKIGRSNTPTDPAPLAMVETTAMLKIEDQWPKRIIDNGFIKGIALKVLDNVVADNRLDKSKIARDTEDMARPNLNKYIRLRLISGEDLAAIKNDLPARIKDEILSALTGVLKTEGVALDGLKVDSISIDLAQIPLRKTTFDELTKEEMHREVTIPGMPNWWLMPIQTRVGMITTGMRGYLGLKVFGTKLKDIDDVGVKIEGILREMPETTAVFADRPLGGYYLDIKILKDECARFGLTSDDVAMYIETAIGGMNISETVEGRFRFPINLRYPPELRDDPEKIKRVLIHTPHGYVPLGQLAEVKLVQGPPMIKSENGLLISYVPVDFATGVSLGDYVSKGEQAIQKAIKEGRLTIPVGTYYKWSGQFEFMERVKERLMFIIPVTLIIIFILLYFAMKDIVMTLIAEVTLVFALVGGVWYMYLLDHNWSLAAAMGMIALAGLASETAVIMHVYLDLSYHQRKPKNIGELNEAVIEGAVTRVRPKMMTVCTTILALIPIMFATGAGASAMQRIAAPMIGGLVTSTIHTLVLIPVYFGIIKGVVVKKGGEV